MNRMWRSRILILLGMFLQHSIGVCANDHAEIHIRVPTTVFEMKQIQFWIRVFAEWTTEDRIFHEVNDLGVIHAVIRDPKINDSEVMAQVLPPPTQWRVQRGQRDRIKTGFEIAKQYLSRIQKIFSEERVPPELSMLAFIESGFVDSAVSKVGAVGVWQIMPQSAKGKLLINDWVDERLDPLKSARAAAKLLKENERILQSWPLAIMAYHQGVTRVSKWVAKYQTKDASQLIRKIQDPDFGFASKNYLFEFYAMLDLWRAKKDLFEFKKLPEFITVTFRKPVSVNELKRVFSIDIDKIAEVNPHFLKPVLAGAAKIPAKYPIRLPDLSLEQFKALSNSGGLN